MSPATGRPRAAVGLALLLLIGGVAAALALVDSGGHAVPPASPSSSAGSTGALGSSPPTATPDAGASGQTGSGGGPSATAGSNPPSIGSGPSAAASASAPAAGDLATDGRIAYVDATGTLFTIAPDGTDSRQLGTAGQPVIFPAWSPDGRHVAAIGADNAPGVWVFTDRAGTSRIGPLGTGPTSAPIYLEWSPSGARLAWLANQPPTLALHVVEFDGTSLGVDRGLVGGQPIYWAWAADSESLLVHVGSGAGGSLDRIALSDRVVTPVLPAPGFFGAPGIDRAGDLEAWVVGSGSTDQQLVLSGPRAGTGHAVPVPGPTALGVDPTGDRVAWIASTRPDAPASGPLHVVDAASGTDRVLVADQVVAFFWSPDGRHIAVLTSTAPGTNGGSAWTDGSAVDLAATGPRPAAVTEPRLAAATVPRLAATGPRLAATNPSLRVSVVDVASGTVTVLAEFSPPPLFASQFLPFFDQYAPSHSIWSPRGDAIVLPSIDDTGQAHLSVVPIDGRPPIRIADGILASWSP